MTMIYHFKQSKTNQMKVRTKKSVVKKTATKKVRSNSIVRTRAFVYDLHAKCCSNHRIVLNDMVVYHKCGNNILAAMRDKYFKRIKVTADDDRGYTWIGQAPDEQIILSIQNEVGLIQRTYLEQHYAKAKQSEHSKLEFVFDNEVPEMVPATVEADSENRIQEFNQFKELFKKFFGV